MSITQAAENFTQALVALVGEVANGSAGRDPVASSTATKPSKATKPPKEKETTKEAPPEVEGPSAKQVADAVINLADTTTRDIAVAVLKEFGAGRVAEVKPVDYAMVLKAVTKAKAKFEAEAAKAAAAASNDSLV
jgi:hypothetical protein